MFASSVALPPAAAFSGRTAALPRFVEETNLADVRSVLADKVVHP